MYNSYEEDLDKFLDRELGKPSLTKKGQPRKRKPKEPRIYFTQDTEEAILQYVSETDNEIRNQIYNKRISYAFYKLAENIIHSFNFYHTDTDTVEELKYNVIGFLLEKLPLYKQNKGKAFSYFGTIAKRYLIVYNNKNYKKLQEQVDVSSVDENESIVIEDKYDMLDDIDIEKFIDMYVNHVSNRLYDIFPKSTDNKTADAILELFRKRESINIFNKKALYIYIREIHDVSTPQISRVIKKLKEIYIELYNIYYKTGIVDI